MDEWGRWRSQSGERGGKWAHCSFFTFWRLTYCFPASQTHLWLQQWVWPGWAPNAWICKINWGCEWCKSLARRSVQMLMLRCGAECWHRNETLGDLNYVCKRQRINHCWGLHISFRKIIAFYILQKTSAGQLTSRRLLRRRGGTWGRSMVNKLKRVQWNNTGRNHSNGERSNKRVGKRKLSASS